MTREQKTSIGPAAPFFIVRDVPRTVAYYAEHLGFELRYLAPDDAPFFAILGRGSAQLFFKSLGDDVQAQPNPTRHSWAPWDAFVSVEDPDALAAEYEGREVELHVPLVDREDGLRGFEVRDPDGYVLFFGRPTGRP